MAIPCSNDAIFETKSMQLKCIYSWYEVPLLKATSQVRMCHMDWSTWIFWKEHGHNADKKCIPNLTWKANEARLCVFNSKSIGLYVLNCFRTCVIETLGAAVPLYLWVNGQSLSSIPSCIRLYPFITFYTRNCTPTHLLLWYIDAESIRVPCARATRRFSCRCPRKPGVQFQMRIVWAPVFKPKDGWKPWPILDTLRKIGFGYPTLVH